MDSVTVDVVMLAIRELPKDPERKRRPRLELCAALVRREEEPFKGCRALPGDFVMRDPHGRQESLDDTALRTLSDAIGVSVQQFEQFYLDQLRAYGEPTRDPGGSVSVAYVAVVPPTVVAEGEGRLAMRAGLAAQRGQPRAIAAPAVAEWTPVNEVLADASTLAFDHAQILADAVKRVAALIDSTALATAFLDAAFTVPQLRRVYEIVWGLGHNVLDSSNFHSRVSKMPEVFERLEDAAAATEETVPARGDILAKSSAVSFDVSDSNVASAPSLWSQASPGRPPSSYFRRGRRILEQGFTAPLDRPIRTRR